MTTSISDESLTQLTRVARGGTLNLVGAVVAAVAGFALVAVVARTFSKEIAGVLFASTSVFLIVVSLAVFGADTGLAHFVLRFEETDRSGDIPIVLRCARRPVFMASVALSAAMVVLADPVASMLGFDAPGSAAVLRILACAVPFAAMAQLALSETRSLGRMRPTVLIDNVLRTSAQTIAAALVGAFGGGLLMLTIGWAVPYVLAAVVALPTARWYLRRRSRRWADTTASDPAGVRREFWRYTLPRGVGRLSQIIVQRADVVVIAATLGAAPAAVYAAATRFVVVGQMGTQAITNVLMPRMAQLLARRDLATVTVVFKISTAWSMAVSWPLYAVIGCAATLYLNIFGSGYVGTDGVPVVVTMALAMMGATAAGALDTLLLMSGKSVASLVNGLVAAFIDIGLCIILIPRVGIVGAAIAWAVAVLVRNLLAFVQVRAELDVTPLSRAAGVVAAAVLACYVGPLLVISLVGTLTVLSLAIAVSVGTVVYVAIIWGARSLLVLSVFRSLLPRRLQRHIDDVEDRLVRD